MASQPWKQPLALGRSEERDEGRRVATQCQHSSARDDQTLTKPQEEPTARCRWQAARESCRTPLAWLALSMSSYPKSERAYHSSKPSSPSSTRELFRRSACMTTSYRCSRRIKTSRVVKGFLATIPLLYRPPVKHAFWILRDCTYLASDAQSLAAELGCLSSSVLRVIFGNMRMCI